MVLKITPLSADVLKIIGIMAEARQNPPREHELTEREIQKLIVDLQDPGVQDAITLGLTQLRDALVQDLESKGPLPASIVELLQEPTLPVEGSTTAASPQYYPNASYDPTVAYAQAQHAPPTRQSTASRSSSPPRSGAIRRPPSKRKYDTVNSPFVTCQWDSCGQPVEKTSSAIVAHLLKRHRIDLKSRNGTMLCGWAGCREDLLITSVVKHIRSTHLRLTVVECPYCPDRRHFSRVDSLNVHIRAQHANLFDGPPPKKNQSPMNLCFS